MLAVTSRSFYKIYFYYQIIVPRTPLCPVHVCRDSDSGHTFDLNLPYGQFCHTLSSVADIFSPSLDLFFALGYLLSLLQKVVDRLLSVVKAHRVRHIFPRLNMLRSVCGVFRYGKDMLRLNYHDRPVVRRCLLWLFNS